MIQRGQVGRREIADMDVIADAGAVGGWVVVTKKLDGLAGYGGSEQEGDQVGFGLMLLAQVGFGLGCAGVEVAEDHAAEASVAVEIGEDALDHGFRFSIGADGGEGRILGDGRFFRIAVDGGGGGKNQALHIGSGHGFEKRERSAEVVGEVELGLAGGFADGDVGGEVDHGVDAFEEFRQSRGVLEADYIQEIGGDGFAVASGKVVGYDDFEASFKEMVGGDGADVAGSSGD